MDRSSIIYNYMQFGCLSLYSKFNLRITKIPNKNPLIFLQRQFGAHPQYFFSHTVIHKVCFKGLANRCKLRLLKELSRYMYVCARSLLGRDVRSDGVTDGGECL